jgi:hypothetical protein
MENGKIRDNQITASTQYNYGHRAANGRLNFRAGSGRTGAWSSRRNDRNQWLQVDFQRSTIITGISTQGRQEATQFIKSYTISFSDDGKSFRSYKPGGMLKVSRIVVFLIRYIRNCIMTLLLLALINFRYSMETATGAPLSTMLLHLLLRLDSFAFTQESGMIISL